MTSLGFEYDQSMFESTSNYSDDYKTDSDFETVEQVDIAAAPHVPETDGNDFGFSDLLYKGATLTLGLSIILIMSFAINHNLTDAAVRDLLQILSLHCPSPNICVTSLYIFKKHFAATLFNSKRHYYCPMCKSSIGGLQMKCPNRECGKRLTDDNQGYFTEISILDQLRNIFNRPGLHAQLQHRFTRTKSNQSSIEDVYDGRLYKELLQPGQFLANPNNISFQLNTDGVSLLHSSNYAMWPVYLKINELPVRMRCKMRNRLLAGIWFGEAHPTVNTFLKPIYATLLKLYNDGVSLDSPDVGRGILLSNTSDLPAKAMLLNMISHNGFYSCAKCLQPGKTTRTGKGSGHAHTFPCFLRSCRSTKNHQKTVGKKCKRRFSRRGIC